MTETVRRHDGSQSIASHTAILCTYWRLTRPKEWLFSGRDEGETEFGEDRSWNPAASGFICGGHTWSAPSDRTMCHGAGCSCHRPPLRS